MRPEILRNLSQTYSNSEQPRPYYRGKVRDVFLDNEHLLIVATDRVSVFDQVVGTVPLKGALLTAQSSFWLRHAEAVLKTHLISQEDPQIQRCLRAEPFKFEIVIRGYLAGSLLRESTDNRGLKYGLTLDPNLKAYEPFEHPILTPSTKAFFGQHDEPISLCEIISQGLATKSQLDFIVESAFNLFELGSAFAKTRGLILADTKYEFGLCGNEIILIDEIHTADSSRYWLLESFKQRIARGLEPEMLDKERLRRVLISQGVDPKGSSSIPPLFDEMRIDLSQHYWELTEKITGLSFQPPSVPASVRIPHFLKSLH